MSEFDSLCESTCGFCGRKLYTFASRNRGAAFSCGGCGVRYLENGKIESMEKNDDWSKWEWVEVPEGTLLVRERL
jgi:hypothetical protein